MGRFAPRIALLWLLAGIALFAAGGGLAGAATRTVAAGPAAVGLSGLPPRLVVVISIDQFRGDYLTRFSDLWLPAGSGRAGQGKGKAAAGRRVGGFRYLMERGAYFTDVHHDHYPLFTGPGHAVLLTGAPPYKSGIVGHAWYDRDLGRRRYCVGDETSPLVGLAAPGGTASGATGTLSGAAARTGGSPAARRVETVGDELKMATGGRARVWGLALKDRAAVLMAGRLAGGALVVGGPSGGGVTRR